MRIESKIAGYSGVILQDGDKFIITIYSAESPQPLNFGPYNIEERERAIEMLDAFCKEMDVLEEIENTLWKARQKQ